MGKFSYRNKVYFIMLHVTNSDNAAKLIEAALDTQNVIAWRDILYEGPVFNEELEELSMENIPIKIN